MVTPAFRATINAINLKAVRVTGDLRQSAVILAALLLAGCYQAIPAGRDGLMFRVNRLTGAVSACTTTECWPAKEVGQPP